MIFSSCREGPHDADQKRPAARGSQVRQRVSGRWRCGFNRRRRRGHGRLARTPPARRHDRGLNQVNFNVRIELDPTNVPLKLDMTASARIIGEFHADVLTVPLAALHADPAGGQQVEVINATGTQRVNVTVGLNVGTQVEISGDLKDGDKVSWTVTPRRTPGFMSGQ